MAGIDEVLERLVTDTDFRTELRTDPQAALAGYELSRDDLALLASQLDDDSAPDHRVETRTTKSGLAFALSQLGGLDSGFPDVDTSSPAQPTTAGQHDLKVTDDDWFKIGAIDGEPDGLSAEVPVQEQDVLGANEKWLRGDSGAFNEEDATAELAGEQTSEGPEGHPDHLKRKDFVVVDSNEDDLEPDGLTGPETEPEPWKLKPTYVTSYHTSGATDDGVPGPDAVGQELPGTPDAEPSDAITASRFGISMDGVQLGDDKPYVLGQLANPADESEIYDYPGFYGEKADEVPASEDSAEVYGSSHEVLSPPDATSPSGEHVVQYPESDLDFLQERPGTPKNPTDEIGPDQPSPAQGQMNMQGMRDQILAQDKLDALDGDPDSFDVTGDSG